MYCWWFWLYNCDNSLGSDIHELDQVSKGIISPKENCRPKSILPVVSKTHESSMYDNYSGDIDQSHYVPCSMQV